MIFDERIILIALQLASAVFGILAAIAWGASAVGHTKTPTVGWGGVVSDQDPFIKDVMRANALNRWGAGFAAIAAFLSAGATVLSI